MDYEALYQKRLEALRRKVDNPHKRWVFGAFGKAREDEVSDFPKDLNESIILPKNGAMKMVEDKGLITKEDGSKMYHRSLWVYGGKEYFADVEISPQQQLTAFQLYTRGAEIVRSQAVK